MRLAAVEGGGTSWAVAIMQDSCDNIVERERFPTTTPEETLGKIKNWLKRHTFDAIGVATFGPVDANANSKHYGFITSTPKPNWAFVDVLGLLGVKDMNIPYKFDTDVNAPAFAEYILDKDDNIESCAYITVGTGIGVGLVSNGKTVHGLMHPEAGHIRAATNPKGDSFAGNCPYHGSCIEGMCASGALCARKGGISADELASLPDDDPVWDQCAYQLGQLCSSLVLICSPDRIRFGGGIMNRMCLYPKIRECVKESLAGYIQKPELSSPGIDNYIQASHWGSNAGLVGASFLAKTALNEVSANVFNVHA